MFAELFFSTEKRYIVSKLNINVIAYMFNGQAKRNCDKYGLFHMIILMVIEYIMLWVIR